MIREERIWAIAQRVERDNQVLTAALAAEFGVSLASIRADLAELERRGLVRRVYGGAVPSHQGKGRAVTAMDETTFRDRVDVYRAEKEAIGRCAAALIANGETIMIDGGTTTYQVCRALADKQKLVVVSCAPHGLWQELTSRGSVEVFLTGGYLRGANGTLVGEVAESTLRGFRANKAILGIDGISLEHGLTTLNFMEAGVKRQMIESSQELIIVADHSKFGRISLIPVAPLARVSTIVTDCGVNPELVRLCEARGVRVKIASACAGTSGDSQDGRC